MPEVNGSWSMLIMAVLIAVLLAAVVAIVTASQRYSASVVAQRVAAPLLIGALAVIILTGFVIGGRASAPPVPNFTPFATISGELHLASTELGLTNIVGNVALYIPVGLLVPLVLRRSWLAGFLVGLALSVGVELVQWITQTGSTDIDDVILNGLGALAGALVGGYASRRLTAADQTRGPGRGESNTLS